MIATFSHAGSGAVVATHHVLCIIQRGSASGRRIVDMAKKNHRYIDTSIGKGIKAYIIMDEGTVVASHLTPRTLQRRFTNDFENIALADQYNILPKLDAVALDTDRTIQDEEDDEEYIPFSELMEFDEQEGADEDDDG